MSLNSHNTPINGGVQWCMVACVTTGRHCPSTGQQQNVVACCCPVEGQQHVAAMLLQHVDAMLLLHVVAVVVAMLLQHVVVVVVAMATACCCNNMHNMQHVVACCCLVAGLPGQQHIVAPPQNNNYSWAWACAQYVRHAHLGPWRLVEAGCKYRRRYIVEAFRETRKMSEVTAPQRLGNHTACKL